MPSNRRTYTGRVISAKMTNTVVIAVDRLRRHPLYGKAMRRRTKVYVDDPQGTCQLGDLVRVVETRPLSKTKRFRFQELLWRREAPVIKEDPAVLEVLAGGPAIAVAEPAVAEAAAEPAVAEVAEEPAVAEAAEDPAVAEAAEEPAVAEAAEEPAVAEAAEEPADDDTPRGTS